MFSKLGQSKRCFVFDRYPQFGATAARRFTEIAPRKVGAFNAPPPSKSRVKRSAVARPDSKQCSDWAQGRESSQVRDSE